MTPWTADAYTAALRFAATHHAGQTFPGTELPYLLHVVNVCAELQAALQHEAVDRPDLAIQCALLHDAVEDTAATRELVAATFGEAVAAGVDALSKREEAGDKPAQMADSLARIQQQPREVWMVKLADRTCNMSKPPHYWDAAKCTRYRVEAGTILAALGPASPWLSARLAGRIEAYPG